MGKKVLFSEGHGEVARTEKSVISTIIGAMGGQIRPFETLRRILLRFNYSLNYSGGRKLSLRYLRNFDILVVNNPVKELHSTEISAIEKFVNMGGSLLLIGRNAYPRVSSIAQRIPLNIMAPLRKVHDVLNNVSRKFGIFFISDWIKPLRKSSWGTPSQDERRRYLSDLELPQISEQELTSLIMAGYLKISNFEPHPVFRKIGKFYYLGCSIELTKEAVPLAHTDTKTHPSNAVVMAIANYGDGRVFGTGSPAIFTDNRIPFVGINNPQQAQLALNIFTWLARRGPIKVKKPKPVVPSKNICPFCSYENLPHEHFCSNCGSSI